MNTLCKIYRYGYVMLAMVCCLALVSSAGGKLRLGECILWTVETIRLGHNASMGCKMVHVDAENYEGIYFLTDEEVLDAAARYRR